MADHTPTTRADDIEGFSVAVVTPPPRAAVAAGRRSSSSDATVGGGGVACHLLPCAVRYDGPAPVHVYFNPTELSIAPGGDDDAPPVLAAQFRGRGLLAPQPANLPADVIGSVLSIPEHGDASTKEGEREVEWVSGTFRSVHEWRHEHDVGVIRRERCEGRGVVERALDWIELSRAVHDPVQP